MSYLYLKVVPTFRYMCDILYELYVSEGRYLDAKLLHISANDIYKSLDNHKCLYHQDRGLKAGKNDTQL